MIYDYRCFDCKDIIEAIRSVADRNDCPTCDCGGETKKIISLYTTHRDLTPYYDPNLETFIQSKQHRKQVMAEQGLSENYGQGWYTSARKHRNSR